MLGPCVVDPCVLDPCVVGPCVVAGPWVAAGPCVGGAFPLSEARAGASVRHTTAATPAEMVVMRMDSSGLSPSKPCATNEIAYSWRSTSFGSIRRARTVGTACAAIDTANKTSATITKVLGSCARTSNSVRSM